MKTWEECLNEVAKSGYYKDWNDLVSFAKTEGIQISPSFYRLAGEKYAEAAVLQDRENIKKQCITNCEGGSFITGLDSLPLPDLN